MQQSTAFLYSLLLGLGVGVLYGGFKIIRVSFCSGRVSVFILDFIFMIISTLAVYIFSVAFIQGYIRVYIILGTLLGFSAYRLSLGRLFSKLYCPVIGFISNIMSKILLKIKIFTKKLLKIAYKILYNIINIRSIFRIKREKPKGKRENFDDEKN